MRRRVFIVFTFVSAIIFAQDSQQISFETPEFLAGPVVAHSMLGATYAYHTKDTAAHAELQISIVTLPAQMRRGEASAEHCISLFMTEVAKSHQAFFAIQTDKRLEAGPLQLTQARWTAKDDTRAVTGVTSCAVDKGRYISISFQDSIETAPDSFPQIRARIKNLKVYD